MKKEMFSFLRINDNFPKILVITIVLYFYKTAFWPLTYLFIISYTVLLFFYIAKFNWKFNFLGFFHDFMLPFVLVGIFIIVFLINVDFSNILVKKDILLILVLFSLFYFLYWNSKTLNSKISFYFTVKIIVGITALISVLNLINLTYISLLPYGLTSILHISSGSTIANDNNFFSLFILFGLIIMHYRDNKNVLFHEYPNYFVYFLNFIFVISIVLSGSRRGIFILVLLSFLYLLYTIRNSSGLFNFKKDVKKLYTFFIIIFLFVLVSFVVFKIVPRYKLSNVVYRYATLVGIDNYNSIEKFLWSGKARLPKKENYLIDSFSFGENIKCWNEYAAPGTILSILKTYFGPGIKLSREAGGSGGISLNYCGPKMIYYADHTYKISFKIKFIEGDFNSFNVGWWVDDGQKGYSNTSALDKEIEPIGDGWYICSSKYTFINSHVGLVGFINSVKDHTSIIIADFELIDLDHNSILPRYAFEFNGKENLSAFIEKHIGVKEELNLINNGDFKDDFVFWKHSADSLTLKITNIDGIKSAFICRGDGNGGNWSLYYTGRNIQFIENNEYQISFKLKPVIPKAIPFFVGYWVNEGKGYMTNLSLKIDTLKSGWLNIMANYTFKKTYSNLIFPISTQIDNSQFYITDIHLVNLTNPQRQPKPIIQISDTMDNETFAFDRTSRWRFGIEVWKTKYNWLNKIIGKGFEHLEWYGEKFLGDSRIYDWPHNPFISVLLYSGIIGLLFYFWFLIRVVYLYYKYRDKYGIAFIGFLITFFFAFFSAGSPFDPPIMGFFMLLPFFIHSIHKNEPPKLTATLTDDKNSNNGD